MEVRRPPVFARQLDITELNAQVDARVRGIVDTTLLLLSVPAGLAFGFMAFGSALWANIFVDGAVDPTVVEVLGSVLPGVVIFGGPAVCLSLLAWRRRQTVARSVVGSCAILPMVMLTSVYGLAAVAAAAALSSAERSWRHRRWSAPAADATALVAGIGLVLLWCVLEAAR